MLKNTKKKKKRSETTKKKKTQKILSSSFVLVFTVEHGASTYVCLEYSVRFHWGIFFFSFSSGCYLEIDLGYRWGSVFTFALGIGVLSGLGMKRPCSLCVLFVCAMFLLFIEGLVSINLVCIVFSNNT